MSLQAGPQIRRRSASGRIARRHGNVDGRQSVLVQAKRFTGEAFDVITGHRITEDSRCYRQSQARPRAVICQHGQTEICIAYFFATLTYCAEFSRLVQTLTRLESQFTVRQEILRAASGTKTLAALGTSSRQQPAAAFGGHPRAKAMGAGTMQITWIEGTFHSTTSKRKLQDKSMKYEIRERRQGYLGRPVVSIDSPLSWS